MKRLVTLIIACSLIVPFGASLADQTTAPGQQKKEAGDGSAKEYAPGQHDDSEAEAKKSKKSQAEAKSDKAKGGSEKAATGATTGKAKAKKK